MILYGDHAMREPHPGRALPKFAHQPPDGHRDSPRRLSDPIWDTLHSGDDRRPVIAAGPQRCSLAAWHHEDRAEMPPEAVSLAIAASIYPPALAAVIALGRGVEVRRRVLLFVVAAYCTAFVTGALMLFLFDELDATRKQVSTPTAGLYVAGGSVLLFVATRLRRDPPRTSPEHASRSRIDRYLQSRWLVVGLGVILYVVPSPIFAGAVKSIADTNVSAGQELAYLAQILLIMLWLIELPMLMLIALPGRSVGALERVNAWFATHGRRMLVLASGGLGIYLIVVGVVELAA
jgi:hypothetical protein